MADRNIVEPCTDKWAPSAKTKLLIKQLGIRSSQLGAALQLYNELQLPSNDEGFLMWLGHYLKSDDKTPLVDAYLIPIDWRPDNALIPELKRLGYTDFHIEFHLEAFVMALREKRSIVKDWGKAYLNYLQTHCTERAARLDEALLLQGFTRRQLDEWSSLYESLPLRDRVSFERFCHGMARG